LPSGNQLFEDASEHRICEFAVVHCAVNLVAEILQRTSSCPGESKLSKTKTTLNKLAAYQAEHTFWFENYVAGPLGCD
jgi:hypothetical protein